MDKSSPPRVINFGCRLNAYESEVMRDHVQAADDPHLVVVNTCAVTAEATRQARQAVRKIARDDPNAKIIVTGCAAQLEPESFAALPGVARVLGNAEKMEARHFRLDDRANAIVRVGDIMSVRDTAPHLLAGFAERARAFVEVQNGCDHRCTFCIIPFGRGPSRSAPAGVVVERIKQLVGVGFQEVVLTGVDVTSYGHDLPGQPTLGNLVQRILKLVPDLQRLRLSSLDMIETDPALLDVLSERRLAPHLHLSLQAGDDMILKRMKRRHSVADALTLTAEFRRRRPDVALGADLIAGFPTETDAMFENSLAHVADCGLVYLHVFPYSARTGTPAARMPQVPLAVRKIRAARLRAEGLRMQSAYFAGLVGQTLDVLIEQADAQDGRGHSGSYVPVRVVGSRLPVGQIIPVRITSARAEEVQGVRG